MTDDFASNPKLTPTLVEYLRNSGIESLTNIQVLAIASGVATGASAIVSAPTSSGKTLVGELASANALETGFDVLYLVSHKALADQKFADFGERFSSDRWRFPATVGMSTGDREVGDVNSRLLVATYEKALGLLLSGRLKVQRTVVIADELQIIGDTNRGSSIETFCALLRQQQSQQFVGLTATVENPEELAAWMNCATVRSATRDVKLLQSIRYEGELHTVEFGQEDGDTAEDAFGDLDLHGVIRKILADGLGPVLVFTESRREAADLAEEFCKRSQRRPQGLEISRRLDLFSEPTQSSNSLKEHAERLVTFHTADLSSHERGVIEDGISQCHFEVCFATSTLAAGVNFPFRTVIFPKLTYEWGDRQGRLFDLSDYRNMSGRAGRLGHHPDGRALLLPKNNVELKHSNRLVTPENQRVESQLVNVSMRRTVLSLVVAKAINSRDQVRTFFENTFHWHVIAEKNPHRLEPMLAKATKAIDWLLEHRFIEESHSTILATPLGRATALCGLLPSTVQQFAELLAKHSDELVTDFDAHATALIHWVVTCPEFKGPVPSRFLPFAAGQAKPESSEFVRTILHLVPWDKTDNQVTRCIHALALFINGDAERKIAFATRISAGHLQRLSVDCSWILDGLSCITGVTSLGQPQALSNRVSMLARQVRWGTPIEALDVLRIASRSNVPGFGRQRVMALLANGYKSVLDIVRAPKDQLAKLLGGPERATALVAALSDTVDSTSINFQPLHLQLGRELGIEQRVSDCYQMLGTEYEDAVLALLREESNWSVDKLDDGKRQNVPDIVLSFAGTSLLIECKTVSKKPPLVGKEDAFAVLQKAADFDKSMRRITLGKPDFDEVSKSKAAASPDITLVSNAAFMEGLMRVLTGRLSASDFVQWLAQPGATDLARLSGLPTYATPAAPLDG